MQLYFAINHHFQLLFNRVIFVVLLALATVGCAYKVPTSFFSHMPELKEHNKQPPPPFLMEENKRQALSHWLYEVVPRHRCQIQWYDLGHWCTWMLFGNDDDGIFGEEPTAHYLLDKEIAFPKALRWFLRNPLHNFCFYVIGSAHRSNSELTLLEITPSKVCALQYCPLAHKVFASKNSSSFFLAMHGGKPFMSLRLIYCPHKQGEFYIGWRCRGNFGIKCIFWKDRKKFGVGDLSLQLDTSFS